MAGNGYSKQQWRDGDPETPITAERLTHIEDGIANLELKKGDPGADGFPTEAQWNELVARVDALEGAPIE